MNHSFHPLNRGPAPKTADGAFDPENGLLEFLREVHAHSPVGFGFLNRDFRFRCVNDAFAKLNGHPIDEHIGRTLSEISPDAAAVADPLLKEVLESGKGFTDVEVTFFHEAIHHHSVLSFYPVRSSQGEVVGVAVTATDVSDRKHSEQKLRQTTGDLLRSNEDLQRFAYIASHDLQEPLRMIANYIGLLESKQKGALDEEAKIYMGFILDGAARMRTLIMDLMEYTDLCSGLKAACRLSAMTVVRDALQDFEATIKETGALIDVGPLPHVFCDPVQLGQLFQNLLGNALKFRGSAAPRIKISATRVGPDWRFKVKDNGIGIDTRYSDQVFEPFRRLHSRKDYSGTGIGLAICRRVVESHRGKIWLRSELEKGTTVFFTLPAQD